MAGTDDGNRQVALTVDQVAIALGLNAEQFDKLVELGVQQDANLDGINGAINKLAEGIAPVDSSLAAEIASLKQEIVIGFSGMSQSIANLNNVIFDAQNNLAKWLAAIALAASTPDDNSIEVQRKIDEATASMKSSTDALDAAVRNNQSKL